MTTEATTSKTDTTTMKLLLIESKNLMHDLFARGKFQLGGPTNNRMDHLIRLIDRTVYGQ